MSLERSNRRGIVSRVLMVTTLAAGVTLGARPSTGPSPSLQPHMSAAALLEAYSHGDCDAVESDLTTRTDEVSAFRRVLEDASGTWFAKSALGELQRRHLIAATVALEGARAMKPRPDPNRMTESQWADRVSLIEWAGRLLGETDPPLPAERWWHLAALALLEQAYGYPFYAFEGVWGAGRRELEEARLRVPDEPRLALAEPTMAEENAGFLGYPLDDLPISRYKTPHYDVRVVEGPKGADLQLESRRQTPFPTDPQDYRAALREAVRGFSALTSRDVIGAEAELHLGVIELSLDQPDLALPHLTRTADSLSEPLLRYAARFYSGAALARIGQTQEAEVAFRTALQTIPRAESATVGLSWLLMLNQHRPDAADLVAGELAAPSSSIDPLALFGLGDARLWPHFIGQLRSGLATQ